MSPLGISNSFSGLFGLLSSTGGASGAGSAIGNSGQGDFSSSLALRVATLQSQSMNSLIGSVFGGTGDGGGSSTGASPFDFLGAAAGLGGAQGKAADPLSFFGLSGAGANLSSNPSSTLSSFGRNLSLFDPESAYRMMTNINNRDVNYKAQFAELSEMKDAVARMQQAGQALAGIGETTDAAAFKSQLQDFVGKYNDWVGRFDGTVQSGGVLAGTQAAEVSLYELKQSIENPFNGAMQGIHGLRDLGVSIDPKTHLAALDTGKLDAVLAANRPGAVGAVAEFSGNFAKSAELLNSDNNFIPNRLANLDRVIDYLSDNKASLQAEFGLGDPARPSAKVARALAAYNEMVRG